MTKFKEYIIEKNEILDIVDDFIDHCKRNGNKRVLRKMAQSNKGFVRNMNYVSSVSGFDKRTQSNRRPLDTPLITHNIINNWFEKKFNWRARSENTLFCWSPTIKVKYFLVVPTSKIEKIVASRFVMDLWDELEDFSYSEDPVFEEALDKLKYREWTIDEIFKINKRIEVMIKCEKYSFLKADIVTEWAIINGIHPDKSLQEIGKRAL